MKRLIVTVVVVVASVCVVGCTPQPTVIDTEAVRLDFVKKGWIPSTLPLGSTLLRDPDTNACTITSPKLPRGFEANFMREGSSAWRITSTPPAPIVMACER